MTISFRCPSCQSVFTVPADAAGKKSFCPKCQQRLQIPAPAPTQPVSRKKTVLGQVVEVDVEPVKVPSRWTPKRWIVVGFAVFFAVTVPVVVWVWAKVAAGITSGEISVPAVAASLKSRDSWREADIEDYLTTHGWPCFRIHTFARRTFLIPGPLPDAQMRESLSVTLGENSPGVIILETFDSPATAEHAVGESRRLRGEQSRAWGRFQFRGRPDLVNQVVSLLP